MFSTRLDGIEVHAHFPAINLVAGEKELIVQTGENDKTFARMASQINIHLAYWICYWKANPNKNTNNWS